MAGMWQQTKGPKGRPGIYVQDTARGGKRYKVAFRDKNGAVTSKTFPRLEDAKAFQEGLGIRKREGTLPDTSKARRTVAELWAFFEETREGRGGDPIKPSTFASYEARWTKHIGPKWGKRRVGEVSREELKTWLKALQEKTSLDTRRKVQQVIHKLFAVAVGEGWRPINPADGIPMPGARIEREPNALTDEEIGKIAAEVPARYRALVWTLAETGARIGELTALRVKNLNGSIRIVENAPEVGGRKVAGTPKTKGSERPVPISPKLRQVLREHYDAGYANRFDPESYVFTGERGAPIGQGNFRKRILQPAAARAGVEDVTTHDFRHTAISLWLTRGLTPFEVAKMVGHTDLKMLERRYGHLYEHALQEKIDRLSSPVALR
jgi:integrase